MVIANSDSNSTLVSLVDTKPFQEYAAYEYDYSNDNNSCVAGDESTSTCSSTSTFASTASLVRTRLLLSNGEYLYLPRDCHDLDQQGQRLDEYLLDVLPKEASLLLSNPPKRFSSTSSERVLYVAQGERANVATSTSAVNSSDDDVDVLVSDQATTCHILAFRSSSTTTNEGRASLTSMTHLDGPHYEDCIRSMVQEHVEYHHQQQQQDFNNQVTLDIHVVGGFDDDDGTSAAITQWLVLLLAQLADEYGSSSSLSFLDFCLKTCAVTAMNDTGDSCPIGRGFAVHLETGNVCLAKCDQDLGGPVPVLRSVRLWSSPEPSSQQQRSLSVVHSYRQPNIFVVHPFVFRKPCKGMESLLTLPDDQLLQCTSTSPLVEEEGFCHAIRQSVRFLQRYSCQQVFGKYVHRPLLFRRRRRRRPSSKDTLNEWEPIMMM
mmetsp:Transcript_3474/g.6535  ORF Transcript_3474/g.6535 Transcript_3474/m.6535 type:complete len:432 (-) Transcript_3474:380-1675(-)